MILDAQLQLSAAQAITADAGSTNYIDLSVQRNLFDGQPMGVLFHVSVAADFTTGDETYAFQAQCDDNTSFSSATTLATRTIAASALTANSLHFLPVPHGLNVERYFRAYYDVGGTTPTITVTAYLIPQAFADKFKAYADAITIS